jgi:hypothetical protein
MAAVAKILSVVDTRSFEEQGDRWVPIPGSGDARECDRCGRLHEVHATVEYVDGKTAVVGTGCMELPTQVGRKYASRAASLAKLRAELAATEAQIEAIHVAEREVETLTPPEATYTRARWTPEVELVVVGDAGMSLQFCRTEKDRAERLEEARRDWRLNRLRERVGHLPLYSWEQRREAVQACIERAEIKLSRVFAEK